MKLFFLSIALGFMFSTSFAQRGLFNQKYVQIAEDFKLSDQELNTYRSKGKIVIFNEEKHKTRLAKTLLKYRAGKTKSFDKGYYKIDYEILSKQDITHHRVRYIFIDKNKFESDGEFENYIKKVRGLLEHTNFKSVAMQYSMDYMKHSGGDTGWFKEGKTHPEFFKAVTNTNRLAEEIFEFEIPQNNWYYFAKKTHSKRDIKEILVLEMQENN